MNKYIISIFLIFTCVVFKSNSQTKTAQNSSIIKGYFSVSHPLLTDDANGISYNFKDSYSVSFPCGINIFKNNKVGYSFEFSPSIKSGNGLSKMNNFSFNPGIIFKYPHSINLLYRLAFETSGRYGATFVFNKVLYKTDGYSYWFSIPVPVRAGNNAPVSIGVGLQLGFTF
jgi:hypothetical protein